MKAAYVLTRALLFRRDAARYASLDTGARFRPALRPDCGKPSTMWTPKAAAFYRHDPRQRCQRHEPIPACHRIGRHRRHRSQIPQLILSDQDAPIHEGFANPDSNNLILQTILGPSMRLEIQAFHGGRARPQRLMGREQPGPGTSLVRRLEHVRSSAGRCPVAARRHGPHDTLRLVPVLRTRLRAQDNKPAGCSLLPSDVKFAGPVTVTVGM